MCTCYFKHVTFSWISCVDWASQNATVATSFRMGISTVQSRPSSSATRGRGCMGPFIMGGLMPKNARSEGQRVRSAEQKKKRRQGRHGWKSRLWCWNTTSVLVLYFIQTSSVYFCVGNFKVKIRMRSQAHTRPLLYLHPIMFLFWGGGCHANSDNRRGGKKAVSRSSCLPVAELIPLVWGHVSQLFFSS